MDHWTRDGRYFERRHLINQIYTRDEQKVYGNHFQTFLVLKWFPTMFSIFLIDFGAYLTKRFQERFKKPMTTAPPMLSAIEFETFSKPFQTVLKTFGCSHGVH